MKLATLKDGSRDGQLVVVSRDLAQAHFATASVRTMRTLLDDWNFISPQLEDLYAMLNSGKARHAFAFDPRACLAPLPRAFQWACSAGAAGAPGTAEPLSMLQGSGDTLRGANDDAVLTNPDPATTWQAGVAVISGDLAAGSDAHAALDSVRLLMLAVSWCLPTMPATHFSPVAATPDELGQAWRGGRVQTALAARFNGRSEALPPMRFHFGQLIAHLAADRNLCAGSVIGNLTAEPKTAAPGDSVRIELPGADGQSVFGAIDQRLVARA